MNILLCVSAAEAETSQLLADGPRRDFVELARATGGQVLYGQKRSGRGLLGKLIGPHVRQAWRTAGRTRKGDIVFADGEHVGIPLLLFLALRRRRPARVVMLGHLPGRLWKRAMLWLATRAGPSGRMLVHSAEQARSVAPALGSRWETLLTPYQVDTHYWAGEAPEAPEEATPLLLAVGSEHRDYATLVRAVDGLPVRVLIAAGSHWARSTAVAGDVPVNVEYLSRPLPFHELRELYQAASAVVVPLEDVPNQSGVTTILEAMSMTRPVVVTASRGQRECVSGPLVRPSGDLDRHATADRGPRTFGFDGADPAQTGLYVAPGDVAALRAAILMLVNDERLARRLAEAGRAAVVRHFTFEQYIERLASALLTDTAPVAAPVAVGERS